MNGTSVSKGNIKLGEGDTWQVNINPHETCQDKPCYKEGLCYNFKAWRQWPSCRKSWSHNFNHYVDNPNGFFDDVIGKITRARKPPVWFRWQAAGEIVDQVYFDGMKRVAIACPDVKFLAFTKRYDLKLHRIPENLEVVISAWPGVEIPQHLRRRFPVAWMMDGRETRRTRKLAKCPGYCPKCRACWSLSRTKRDVAFIKH